MRRTTPLALMVASVGFTAAAGLFIAAPAPDGRWPWFAGLGAIGSVVFVGSQSPIREKIPFLLSHKSRWRRLRTRGQELQHRVRVSTPRHFVALASLEPLVADLTKWGEDCQRLADDLGDPRFGDGLHGIALGPAQADGTVYCQELRDWLKERLHRLDGLLDLAYREDG